MQVVSARQEKEAEMLTPRALAAERAEAKAKERGVPPPMSGFQFAALSMGAAGGAMGGGMAGYGGGMGGGYGGYGGMRHPGGTLFEQEMLIDRHRQDNPYASSSDDEERTPEELAMGSGSVEGGARTIAKLGLVDRALASHADGDVVVVSDLDLRFYRPLARLVHSYIAGPVGDEAEAPPLSLRLVHEYIAGRDAVFQRDNDYTIQANIGFMALRVTNRTRAFWAAVHTWLLPSGYLGGFHFISLGRPLDWEVYSSCAAVGAACAVCGRQFASQPSMETTTSFMMLITGLSCFGINLLRFNKDGVAMRPGSWLVGTMSREKMRTVRDASWTPRAA